MFATSVFGNGPDYARISFIVHVGLPFELISWAQMAGRVGRDGTPRRRCHSTLFGAKDGW
ncbi:hypothetical protein LZ31DRAFT_559365 [Colletotrichum somersetense]|nr:hypothetical protein LZ31DRAFT_559365 [Colletotrichum somersetense]